MDTVLAHPVRFGSLFQGWVENPKATFQEYALVPAEIVAKASLDMAHTVIRGLQAHWVWYR